MRLMLAVVLLLQSISAGADDLLNILNQDSSGPQATAQNVDSQMIQNLKREIGAANAEQNIFLTFLKDGQAEKALFQWGSAFKGTAYAKSSSGRALYGYLLFVNGLEVIGVETLFQAEPAKINPQIISLWREVAPATARVWSLAQITWSDVWSKNFDLATEVRVRGRNFQSVKNMEPTVELLKKTSVNSPERAWLEWQLALGLALQGDVAKAGKVLKHLMEAPNNRVTSDHMNITAARLLFQNGYLDPAIQYYSKVPKDSDFWLEAQEEMGWAFLRKGEPQNTLAKTQTLVASVFEDQVGPEAIFLRSLAQLKVCDYPEVVKTLNLFRERFRPKAANLTELAKTGVTDESQKLVDRMKQSRPKMTELGKAALYLPRLASRDEVLFDLVQTQNELEKETKAASALYNRSLSGGTGQVGFQASLEELRKSVETRAQAARSASFNRIRDLAQTELVEFQQILQKLHIVEAEVIQQISQAEKVIAANGGKSDVKAGTTGSQAKDRLVFPFQGETWFDELSNYQVNIKKGCQASAGAAR